MDLYGYRLGLKYKLEVSSAHEFTQRSRLNDQSVVIFFIPGISGLIKALMKEQCRGEKRYGNLLVPIEAESPVRLCAMALCRT